MADVPHRKPVRFLVFSAKERTAALDGWLWIYNHRRPHGSLSHKPPAARLNELQNNPLGSYS